MNSETCRKKFISMTDFSADDVQVRIVSFLQKEKVLNIASYHSDQPWIATCFFAFDTPSMSLIIQSSPGSRHIKESNANPKIAGSVYHHPGKIGQIRGIQFEASICKAKGAEEKRLKRIYLKKFPFARLAEGETFAIELNTVKMTDNTLGFGTKLHWKRS